MVRTSSWRSRYANAEERATTRNEGTCASQLDVSSVSPSQNICCVWPSVMSMNGNTAMVGDCGSGGRFGHNCHQVIAATSATTITSTSQRRGDGRVTVGIAAGNAPGTTGVTDAALCCATSVLSALETLATSRYPLRATVSM